MGPTPTDQESTETRQRILNAAQRIFAEKGFAATSVREITTAAVCNIAAVNYHFGSKEKLYEALFRTTLKRLTDLRVKRISGVLEAADRDPTLTLVLEAFVRSFLEPLLRAEEGAHFIRILQWEMLHPILPPNLFFEEMIQPTMEITVRAMERVCPELHPPLTHLCIMSVVGQLFHLIHMHGFFRAVKTQAAPDLNLDHLIDHVIAFSEAGIKAYAKGC